MAKWNAIAGTLLLGSLFLTSGIRGQDALTSRSLHLSSPPPSPTLTASAEAINISKNNSIPLETKRGLLQKLVNEQPESADAWTAYGEVLQDLGENALAMKVFEKSVSIDPNAYTPWFRIGLLAKRGTPQPDYPGAERAFRRALTEGAPRAQTLNELGVTIAVQERYGEAIEVWKSAVAEDPNWGVLYSNLLKAAARTNNQGLADEYIDGAIDAERFDPSAVLVYADYLTRNNKAARAAEILGRAIAINPENPRLHYYLGLAQADSGSKDAALLSFAKTKELAAGREEFAELVQPAEFEIFRIESPADEARFQEVRKLVFDQQPDGRTLKKNLEKAVRNLTPLIERHPDFWNGYFVRGVANRRLDNREEARADFDRVLELFSEEPNTLMQLALLDRDEHRFSEAAELADKAVRLAPRDATHTVNAGLIMIEAGKCDRAWELYNQTVKLVGEKNAEVLRLELDTRCKGGK